MDENEQASKTKANPPLPRQRSGARPLYDPAQNVSPSWPVLGVISPSPSQAGRALRGTGGLSALRQEAVKRAAGRVASNLPKGAWRPVFFPLLSLFVHWYREAYSEIYHGRDKGISSWAPSTRYEVLRGSKKTEVSKGAISSQEELA